MNTASTDFDLTKGAVSAAISKAGGPALQEEVTNAKTGGVPLGHIIVTSGGSLGCANVYHGALPNWDKPNGQALKVTSSCGCLITQLN